MKRLTTHSSLLLLVAVAAMLSACKETLESQEAQAHAMLMQARMLMADSHFDAARDTIYSMRQRHPRALETRRAAIVTLDSIELMATRDSLEQFERQLEAAREGFKTLKPRVNGRTNQLYYDQQRKVMAMEQHYDELCAKVKFYVRKIDIDGLER
ncbi:MAG: hypothetical protein IKO12_04845 [Bacteroidaceae bacterium]|nr:hypothetical protein [Bacteroidaceae bacterium]